MHNYSSLIVLQSYQFLLNHTKVKTFLYKRDLHHDIFFKNIYTSIIPDGDTLYIKHYFDFGVSGRRPVDGEDLVVVLGYDRIQKEFELLSAESKDN